MGSEKQIFGAIVAFCWILLFTSVCYVHISGGSLSLSSASNNEYQFEIGMPDPKTLLNISQMGQILETPTGQCMKQAEVGGLWKCGGYDGYKEVCFDSWLSPSMDSCTIYSFGAGYDLSFEYDIIGVWGCQVYLYDFSFDHTKLIQDPRIIFKKWGLANTSYISDAGDKFVSYKDALAANGHDKNTDVHYLKLDIEAAEYDVLSDMLEEGYLDFVWQLHMEVHQMNKGANEADRLKIHQERYSKLKKLEEAGFRRIRATPNHIVRTIKGEANNCCEDVLWVNGRRTRIKQ